MSQNRAIFRTARGNGKARPAAGIANPAAERYDMMHQVDRWFIHTLCVHLEHASATGSSFSVNLSGPSLGTRGFSDCIIEQFERHSIDPQRICFEITETAVIANLRGAHAFMERLRALGCRFSVEDGATLALMRSMGVDYAQGYAVGEPRCLDNRDQSLQA